MAVMEMVADTVWVVWLLLLWPPLQPPLPPLHALLLVWLMLQLFASVPSAHAREPRRIMIT